MEAKSKVGLKETRQDGTKSKSDPVEMRQGGLKSEVGHTECAKVQDEVDEKLSKSRSK